MNKKILVLISALVIVALSACGADAPPTLAPADVEGTAVALAWTSLAQTQTAQPTATITPSPIPPTATLFSTATPFPTLPPLQPTVALAGVTPTVHPCNDIPPAAPKGTLAQVKLVNDSEGSVILSFGMNDQNSLGECGTYSFTLGRYDQPIITVLAGCYWAYSWNTYDDASVTNAKSVGLLCIDNTKTVSISIGKETIGFR